MLTELLTAVCVLAALLVLLCVPFALGWAIDKYYRWKRQRALRPKRRRYLHGRKGENK